MIDLQVWIWFSIRLTFYSIILFILFACLLCTLICLYYWFVIRIRSKNQEKIQKQLQNHSFNFHTLRFYLSNSGLINLSIQLSELEKRPIEFAQLNQRKFQISSLDIQDEQVIMNFTSSDVRLTIKHQCFDQTR